MSWNDSAEGSTDTAITGFARGQERFGFLYVVILAVIVGCAMSNRLVHRVGWMETVLVLIGGLFFAWLARRHGAKLEFVHVKSYSAQ